MSVSTVSFNGLSHFRTCHITRKSNSSWKGHLKKSQGVEYRRFFSISPLPPSFCRLTKVQTKQDAMERKLRRRDCGLIVDVEE